MKERLIVFGQHWLKKIKQSPWWLLIVTLSSYTFYTAVIIAVFLVPGLMEDGTLSSSFGDIAQFLEIESVFAVPTICYALLAALVTYYRRKHGERGNTNDKADGKK